MDRTLAALALLAALSTNARIADGTAEGADEGDLADDEREAESVATVAGTNGGACYLWGDGRE